MSDPQQPQNVPPVPPAPAQVAPPPVVSTPAAVAQESSIAPTPGAETPPKSPRGGGLAIAALVLGIAAFILAFTPVAGFALVCAIAGAVLGIVAIARKSAKRGAGVTGLVLSIVAIPLAIIFIVIYAIAGAVVSSVSSSVGSELAKSAAPSADASKSKTVVADSKEWYDKKFGTFTAASQKGTGDTVITLPAGAKAGIVTATHQGSANFSISALDSNNASTGDLLVNTIGNYSGITAFGMHKIGNDPSRLQITADGAWTISIAPVSSAPTVTVPGGATGDQVVRYEGKATTWALSNAGSGNFAVIQYSGSIMPNLAVNEIGTYSGSVPMQAGPSVVVISSNGAWTVK